MKINEILAILKQIEESLLQQDLLGLMKIIKNLGDVMIL